MSQAERNGKSEGRHCKGYFNEGLPEELYTHHAVARRCK
jgi:hypothetical protein